MLICIIFFLVGNIVFMYFGFKFVCVVPRAECLILLDANVDTSKVRGLKRINMECGFQFVGC